MSADRERAGALHRGLCQIFRNRQQSSVARCWKEPLNPARHVDHFAPGSARPRSGERCDPGVSYFVQVVGFTFEFASRGWLSLLLLAACATAPKPARHDVTPPLPSVSSARSINNPDPVHADGVSPRRHPDIHQICAQNTEVGIAWCETIAAGDPKDCVEMCVAEYHSSHPPDRAMSVAPSASPLPDPYFFALAECIHRAREGDARSTCRFSSPLDEMDFGQKHCDLRCAELAGGSPA